MPDLMRGGNGSCGSATRCNAALEAERKDKTIGNSLGREGHAARGRRRRRRCSNSIATNCRCSSSSRRSQLEPAAAARVGARGHRRRAPTGTKCARCWRVVAVGFDRRRDRRAVRSVRRRVRRGGRRRCIAERRASSASAAGRTLRRAAARPLNPRAPSATARPLELGTMAVIVAVDQLTKAIVRQVLPLDEQPHRHSRSSWTSPTSRTPARRSAC